METINFVEGDLICVSVFFSLVQREGAAGGGDSTVCLPISELLSAAQGCGLSWPWPSSFGAAVMVQQRRTPLTPGKDGAEHTAQHWNVLCMG